jgi:Putative Ig domain
VFADANSDTLQVSAVGMPPWLVFQSLGGATPELRFNGEVPLSEVDNAIYTITLTATDPSGASISTTLQVKVVVNVAPVAPASITLPVVKQNLAYSAVVPAFTDANGDTLTYNITTIPPGLVFDGDTRTISGTPTVAGSWTVWYWAYDGIAWTSTTFTMVVEANTAPVAPTVGNQNVTPGSAVNLTLPAFTDANGDTLTYSAGNLPTGLSFNPATRAITGTASTAGGWAVTYQADDGRGGVTSMAFVFTVATAGVNQAPLVAYALADQTAIGGEAFSYTVPANTFVDPEGQTLTYTAAKSDGTALPSWLEFNAATRTFANKPGQLPPLLGSFSWTLRVRATDPQGLYVDATFVLTKEAGGSQLMAPPETFEMGAMSQTSLLAGGGMMAAASLVSVQTKDQWFTYDGENRLKVVNGALVNGVIEVVASTPTYNADSYSVQYDGAGHATAHVLRKTENSVTQTLVTLSTYDLRGNRRYEFHTQVLGGGFAGIAKEFIVDAAGQTLGTRSYFANGTIKQTLVPQGGQEPEVPEDIDVSGWLSDAETMQYDGDGRALMQAVYKRGLQGRENIQAEGNQYADIALLRLQNRVDYTQSDGSNAWTDTDLSNNASGYDAAGRLTTYRYSARNPNGPDWYTHTFTSAYEGWESWQEKTVAGISTNTANFKATTNTLHLDAYGRILKQQETTVGASIDDRVRVYTYSGDGMVQTRREGTVNGSNVFTQSTKAPNNTPQNYQFVYAAGQQLAELQAGGEVRASLPTGGGRFSPQLAQAIYAASGAGGQTNSLSKIVGGSGPYTAGGGMATVLEGETLQSLAQRVYGTSTLWYVLADANGYSDATAPLTAGVQLKTPSVGVNGNDANTFKPYNPNEAIGSTTPGLPYIQPPSPAGCSALAMLIRIVAVVVAAVVSYYAGPQAGWQTYAALAAIGGAGEATAQTVEINQGYRQGYNWGAVAVAALSAGQGGGTLELTRSAAFNLAATAALRAGSNYITSYAVNKITNVEDHFSWRGMLSGMATAGITAGVFNGKGLGQQNLGSTGIAFNFRDVATAAVKEVGRSVVRQGIGYVVNKAFDIETSWNWKQVAASAAIDGASAAAQAWFPRGVDPKELKQVREDVAFAKQLIELARIAKDKAPSIKVDMRLQWQQDDIHVGDPSSPFTIRLQPQNDGWLDAGGLEIVRSYDKSIGNGDSSVAGVLSTFVKSLGESDDPIYGSWERYPSKDAMMAVQFNPMAQQSAALGMMTGFGVQVLSDGANALDVASMVSNPGMYVSAKLTLQSRPDDPMARMIVDRVERKVSNTTDMFAQGMAFIANLPSSLGDAAEAVERQIGYGHAALNHGRYTEAFYHYSKIAYPVVMLATAPVGEFAAGSAMQRVAQLLKVGTKTATSTVARVNIPASAAVANRVRTAETAAANSGIDAIVGAGRKEGSSLFNPTSGKINCVDGVCAFLNTIKTKELHTAIPDSQVSSNGGRIHVALDEIAEKTGVYFGKRNFQFNTLETARERQFFVIFDGASSVDSSHVAIGIVNRGNRTIFDPQSGETFKDFSKFGSGRFISYPLLLDAPIPKKLGN